MTQKETLLIKSYELKNELLALRGKETMNIEDLTTGWWFKREVENARVYALKDKIERLTKDIEEQKAKNEKQARNEAFYQTEAGKAQRAYLEGLRQREEESFTNLQNEYLDNLKAWVKDFLGEHWTVRRASVGDVEFQVWDADKADFVFGSEIDVRYERDCWLKDGAERFDTNIGAMGSFDILDDAPYGRCRYYMDLGKFLSDKGRLEGLKRTMRTYEDKVSEVRSHIGFINFQLENPVISDNQ